MVLVGRLPSPEDSRPTMRSLSLSFGCQRIEQAEMAVRSSSLLLGCRIGQVESIEFALLSLYQNFLPPRIILLHNPRTIKPTVDNPKQVIIQCPNHNLTTTLTRESRPGSSLPAARSCNGRADLPAKKQHQQERDAKRTTPGKRKRRGDERGQDIKSIKW